VFPFHIHFNRRSVFNHYQKLVMLVPVKSCQKNPTRMQHFVFMRATYGFQDG
jgi:hypothetical protein